MTGRLELSPRQMREYGYRVIDLLVELYSSLRAQSVVGKRDPAGLRARLSEPPPERGVPFEIVLGRPERRRFREHGPGESSEVFWVRAERRQFRGRIGESLDSGFNAFEGTWFAGSGPAVVELAVLDWMRQWFGFPERMDGIFVSGGSIANLTALAVAPPRRCASGDGVLSTVSAWWTRSPSIRTNGCFNRLTAGAFLSGKDIF